MADTDLHERLVALIQKIEAAKAHMKLGQKIYDDEIHQTGARLQENYRALKKRLDKEVADAEANGRHVTALEKSVREWIETIDPST